MKKLPKYIIRPNDYAVWERFKDTDLYRTYEYPDREIKNRQDPYNHWNYENLTRGYGFFPIEDHELDKYLEKWNLEIDFRSWQMRSDGHGGIKGGSKEEYLDYLKQVKSFNEKYPNWRKEQHERK
jgi:hypothetical protein